MNSTTLFFLIIIIPGIMLGVGANNMHKLKTNIKELVNNVYIMGDIMLKQKQEIKILKVLLRQCGAKIPEPPVVTQ